MDMIFWAHLVQLSAQNQNIIINLADRILASLGVIVAHSYDRLCLSHKSTLPFPWQRPVCLSEAPRAIGFL